MRVSKRARWALVIVAAAALVLVAAAAARTHSSAKKGPIVIGWAHDDSAGPMGPFDLPALAAAKIELAKIDKKGVLGRKIVLKTCDTQKDDPTASKACADQLIGKGAKIILTTCDVNLAAPVVQEAIKHHLLTVAPCIGTDQLGPKFPFCGGTDLCFSFGNLAQDEGSAMAQFAWDHGWKTADIAKDNAIIYFTAVVNAFKARFTQLGGKIKFQTTYTDSQYHGNNVGNAVSAINAHAKPAVIVTATAGAFGSLAPLITGLRTAGNKTPVLNSWAGDGTYWLPPNPKVTNYWFVTYANAFGQDPSKTVNQLAKTIKAATGGFITGPAAMDGIALAIKRAHGSLVGSKLAAVMQKFHKVPTISGKVSFSKKLHSVFGRAYRVVEINNNKPSEKGMVTAKRVPSSPDQP
ncbi:MAG TPA: ABC transporter substrate-binding protein [Gaiellaceae bacterium]|nr:ABC transporter substrate-binding protein [Gaiellaceae bacterium]